MHYYMQMLAKWLFEDDSLPVVFFKLCLISLAITLGLISLLLAIISPRNGWAAWRKRMYFFVWDEGLNRLSFFFLVIIHTVLLGAFYLCVLSPSPIGRLRATMAVFAVTGWAIYQGLMSLTKLNRLQCRRVAFGGAVFLFAAAYLSSQRL